MSEARQQPNSARIEVAQPEDLGEILEMMEAANQYALAKSGYVMWFTAHAQNMLRLRLARGECFVLRNLDKVIAAAITIDEADSHVWDEQGKDGMALYFHNLMKHPGFAVSSSGRMLIHFAAEEALKRGKKFLRCDTKTSAHDLIEYYETLGLVRQRTATYKHSGLDGTLLQADAQKVLEKSSEKLT